MNNYITRDDYIILTFPRSGTNYLAHLIYQKLRDPDDMDTPILIPQSHDIPDAKGKKVIAIVRDPHETMKSLVTLVRSFPDQERFKRPDGDVYKFPAEQYMEYYAYIAKNSDLIIDYRDLVARPNDVLEYLAAFMGLCVNDKEYVNNLVDGEDYLVSSRTSKLYDTIDYMPHFPGNGLIFACINFYRGSLKKTLKFH